MRLSAQNYEDALMMRIPAATSEDITFHSLGKYLHADTQAFIMDSKELKQFLHSGTMPKGGSFVAQSSNAVNPKKPSMFFTQQKTLMIPPSIGESGDLDI